MRALATRILKALIPREWLYRLRVRRLRRNLRKQPPLDQTPAATAPLPNSQATPAPSGSSNPSGPDLKALAFGADEAATRADVTACYRLFLGRLPDEEGLAAYTDAIDRGGLDLAGLVESFVRSAEFRERRAGLELAAGREYSVLDLELFRMYVLPGDWSVSKSIIATGAMEPHVTAALKELLKPGMTFVDVGANIGYFSMLGARLVGPRGRVIAFEAAPHNCSLISASAGLNQFRNIRIEARAVAEAGGPYLYQSSGSNGRIVPFDAANPDALRGDFLWAGTLEAALAGEERIDVLKIDIEGAEYRALLGAGDLLRRARPVLLSEFSPPQLSQVSAVEASRYLELIQEAGYEFNVLGEDGARLACGDSVERVLEYYERSAKGLLDLLCTPGRAG